MAIVIILAILVLLYFLLKQNGGPGKHSAKPDLKSPVQKSILTDSIANAFKEMRSDGYANLTQQGVTINSVADVLKESPITTNKEQRVAIVFTLGMIAVCDYKEVSGAEYVPNEVKYVGGIAELLGVTMGDRFYMETTTKGADYINTILKTLDKNNTKWFKWAIFNLMSIGVGEIQPSKDKVQIIANIIYKIGGISDQEMQEMINKKRYLDSLY